MEMNPEYPFQIPNLNTFVCIPYEGISDVPGRINSIITNEIGLFAGYIRPLN